MGEFDGYTLVPTSNLRRIADELGMEGGIYASELRREVLDYIEVSPSLFAEAQPPAAGVDVSEAAIFRAADALCGEWNLYYPDAVRMARTALRAAALRTGGGA